MGWGRGAVTSEWFRDPLFDAPHRRSISTAAGDGTWYAGVLAAAHADDGTFDVAYDDGDFEVRGVFVCG